MTAVAVMRSSRVVLPDGPLTTFAKKGAGNEGGFPGAEAKLAKVGGKHSPSPATGPHSDNAIQRRGKTDESTQEHCCLVPVLGRGHGR